MLIKTHRGLFVTTIAFVSMLVTTAAISSAPNSKESPAADNKIPEGMQVVSIGLSRAKFSGLFKPGARVDLYKIFKGRNVGSNKLEIFVQPDLKDTSVYAVHAGNQNKLVVSLLVETDQLADFFKDKEKGIDEVAIWQETSNERIVSIPCAEEVTSVCTAGSNVSLYANTTGGVTELMSNALVVNVSSKRNSIAISVPNEKVPSLLKAKHNNRIHVAMVSSTTRNEELELGKQTDQRVNAGPQEDETKQIQMKTSTSRAIDFGEEVPRVLNSSPEIVQIIPLRPNQLQLTAKNPGIASVDVWLKSGAKKTYRVNVTRDNQPLVSTLKVLYPNSSFELFELPSSIVIRGTVSDERTSQQVVEIAETFYPTVINQLTIANNTQITNDNKSTLMHEMKALRAQVKRLHDDVNQLSTQLRKASASNSPVYR